MRADELPVQFRREIEALLGAQARDFFAAYDQPHARALRLNARRGLTGAAAEPELALAGESPGCGAACALAGGYAGEPVPWQEGARRVDESALPGSSLMHLLGLYYMQEPSAMAAGAALDVRPGMRVLDLCAAPGGKSSQLAAALRGRGLLVANEPVPARAQMLASNLERQGFANAVVTCEYPDRLAARWGARFDAVLVDAPCSGEGMFRRDEEALRQWSPDAPRMCHERQAGILDSAYELLKPGGALVYSTCTFNRMENEESIAAFLRRHSDMAREDFALEGLGASRDGMLRIWPHLVRGEGHFVCRLRKGGEPTAEPARRGGKPRIEQLKSARAAQDALKRLSETVALPALSGESALFGQKLYLLPEGCPELDGVRVVRAGLELCAVGRSHVEPAYALARALAPDRSALSVDTRDALRLVRGEQIERPCADGWTLIHWRGLPVCFGKAHDGIVKSHFPRGLKPLGTLVEESE